MQAPADVRHGHPLLNCVGSGADIRIIHDLGGHQVTHLRQWKSQERAAKSQSNSCRHDTWITYRNVSKAGVKGCEIMVHLDINLLKKLKSVMVTITTHEWTPAHPEWREGFFGISLLGEEVVLLISNFDGGVISNNYWENGRERANPWGMATFADQGFHFLGPLPMFLGSQRCGDIHSRKPQLSQRKHISSQSNQTLTYQLSNQEHLGAEERTFSSYLAEFFFHQQLKGPIVSRLSTVILLVKAKRKRGNLRSSTLRIWKGKD